MKNIQGSLRQQGSTLLEALIALVIFSFGVMGFMKLQMESMRQAADSRFVVMAGAKAQSLMDAITYEKQLSGTVAMPYTDQEWSLSKDKESSSLGNAGTGAILKPWLAGVENGLPGGDASIECVSHICTIQIFWKPGKSVQHDKTITDEQSARYVVQNPSAD